MNEDVTISAFGAGWERVCADLLGDPIALVTGRPPIRRPLIDLTNGNWQVNIYPLDNKRIVVSWQTGTAGPPATNINEFRRIVEEGRRA